jgi:hypothetical protein
VQDKQEIDYIEENNGEISAFEFTWNTKKRAKTVKSFTESYQTEIKTVSPDNFREFLNM